MPEPAIRNASATDAGRNSEHAFPLRVLGMDEGRLPGADRVRSVPSVETPSARCDTAQ